MSCLFQKTVKSFVSNCCNYPPPNHTISFLFRQNVNILETASALNKKLSASFSYTTFFCNPVDWTTHSTYTALQTPSAQQSAFYYGLHYMQMEFIKISSVAKSKPFTQQQRAAAVDQLGHLQITVITTACNTTLSYLFASLQGNDCRKHTLTLPIQQGKG